MKFSELWKISETVEKEQNFRAALMQAGIKKDTVLSEKGREYQKIMKSGGRFKYVIVIFYGLILLTSTVPIFSTASPELILNMKAIVIFSAYISSFFIIFFFSMTRNSDPSIEEVFRFLRTQALTDKDASKIILLSWLRFYLPLIFLVVLLTPILGYVFDNSIIFALANTLVFLADISIAIALSFKASKFMIIQTRRGNSGRVSTLIRVFTLLGYTISLGSLYFAMSLPQTITEFVITAQINLLNPPYVYYLIIPFVGTSYLLSLLLTPIQLNIMQLGIISLSTLLVITFSVLSIPSILNSIKDISQWRIKISTGKVSDAINIKVRGVIKAIILNDLRISLREPSRMAIIALSLFIPMFVLVLNIIDNLFMRIFMFGYLVSLAFIVSIWSLIIFDVRGGSYLAVLPLRGKQIAIAKVSLVSLLLIPGTIAGLVMFYFTFGISIMFLPLILHVSLISVGFVVIYIMAHMLGEGYLAIMDVSSQISAGIVSIFAAVPIILLPLILTYVIFGGTYLGIAIGFATALVLDILGYSLSNLLKD